MRRAGLSGEQGALVALALREAGDRLGRRDPAAREQLVDLHRPVLRQYEQPFAVATNAGGSASSSTMAVRRQRNETARAG